ncbi:MAG: ABC transporter ATP-binding protein [Desulfovibrio sp.]|jgi:peptide/nickel transport system ATP-binding protein|nr:ABC transporter ATP-binding protein [Desulfovibrio sp.]
MNGPADSGALVEIRGLKKYFTVPHGLLQAVDDVNLSVAGGETLGLVGESGCGKSTLGRVVIRLLDATEGSVFFDKEDIFLYNKKALRNFRKRAQMVFQDPYSSLNPRFSVEQLIAEPLHIHRVCVNERETAAKVKTLMDIVGLASRLTTSFPHELDGGRRQRIGIARALALNPEFIVLDEPVSALDVCIQAQILNLLHDLKDEFRYTYLFITHDLSVIRHISDRIAVMYLGKIIELADHLEIFIHPQHPYTQALLSAIPLPNVDIPRAGRIILEGDVPSPVNPPAGCRFYSRCPSRWDRCLGEAPVLRELSPDHFLACHFPGRVDKAKHIRPRTALESAEL